MECSGEMAITEKVRGLPSCIILKFMMHTLPDSDYNEVNVTTTEYILVEASAAKKKGHV